MFSGCCFSPSVQGAILPNMQRLPEKRIRTVPSSHRGQAASPPCCRSPRWHHWSNWWARSTPSSAGQSIKHVENHIPNITNVAPVLWTWLSVSLLPVHTCSCLITLLTAVKITPLRPCAAVQVLWGGVSRTSVCSRAVDRSPAEAHPVAGLQRQSVSSCCSGGSSGTRPTGRCLSPPNPPVRSELRTAERRKNRCSLYCP